MRFQIRLALALAAVCGSAPLLAQDATLDAIKQSHTVKVGGRDASFPFA